LRIVLAYDLSPRADRAAALIARATWPSGTIVRVITSSFGLGLGISSFAGPREVRAHHRQVRRSITIAQGHVAADLAARGLTVETVVADAPPGGAVLEEAGRLEADLIIVGAKEQGPISAALLGSVSTQIMDGATCSVLVSRGPPVERVLLATDGSAPARVAVDIVASWPLFAAAEIRVVGISPPPTGRTSLGGWRAEASTDDPGLADAPAVTIAEAVTEAVDQLMAQRRNVVGRIRTGDPHTHIAGAARDWRTDLVVIGATGRSPLQSILLGSVARRVLHRVSASVLVARGSPARAAAPGS
jgi:nucleotide-binding universal stress UspA family protein